MYSNTAMQHIVINITSREGTSKGVGEYEDARSDRKRERERERERAFIREGNRAPIILARYAQAERTKSFMCCCPHDFVATID